MKEAEMVKVRVADDEDMVRLVVKQTLAKAGIDVVEAGNGREALEKQASDPADVLITDIIMPEQEGIETIVQMRKDYPDLPIIAMSGGGRIGATDYLQAAKEFGARHVLEKPFDRKELLLAVQDCLGTVAA